MKSKTMMTLDKFYSDVSQEDIKWLNKQRKDWMNDDQFLCWLFLSQLFCGFHHVPNEPKYAAPNGISTTIINSMATHDSDKLTKLVIMAHNWGIRCSLEPCMRYMKLYLHVRSQRTGSISKRHPQILEKVKLYKKK